MLPAMGLGKMLMLFGAILFLVGFVVMVGGRFELGNLPGDIGWRKGNTSVYFPIASSIVLSLVLTFVLNVVLRFLR